MATCFGDLYNILFKPLPIKVLILGLPCGVGKTSTLLRLQSGIGSSEKFITVYTSGFNVANFYYKNVEFCMWDIGGGDKFIPLWRHYFQEDVRAIIYVVDSTDRDWMGFCKETFDKLLLDTHALTKIILVLANKQDLPGAMSTEEITETLEIKSQKYHDYDILVQPCCAVTGVGLFEGMDWLLEKLSAKKT